MTLLHLLRYIGLGDSISIDDYAGGPGRGAISLLHRNRDRDFPAFRARDLISTHPGVAFHYLAWDGATTHDVLDDQLPRAADHRGAGRTVVTLTAGGNDLLLTLGEKGHLEPEDGERLIERTERILHEITNHWPDSLVLLNTIYDPTDGVGDLLEPGVPLEREMRVFDQVNGAIRALADGQRIRLADLHRHFLGHGSHHDDPTHPHHHPEDPTPWFTFTIEPNGRGASEVRRVWWRALVEAGWVTEPEDPPTSLFP